MFSRESREHVQHVENILIYVHYENKSFTLDRCFMITTSRTTRIRVRALYCLGRTTVLRVLQYA